MEILKRINNGYDGIIRDIHINKSCTNAHIIVSVMDIDKDFEWINVEFVLEGLQEFKVMQKIHTSNAVLSSGIIVKQFDSSTLYVDFAPYSDEIDTIEDIRNSDIYFGCKTIDWHELPYSE